MKKVGLNMKENEKYKIIKKLVETDGNKQRALAKIGCSNRHLNRLIAGYAEHGKAYFVHGNRGRKSPKVIDQKTKESIVELYLTKYSGSNFVQFSEFLEEEGKIKVSVSAITSILREQHIISPKAHRCTKKSFKKELKILQSKTTSIKECQKIHIVDFFLFLRMRSISLYSSNNRGNSMSVPNPKWTLKFFDNIALFLFSLNV